MHVHSFVNDHQLWIFACIYGHFSCVQHSILTQLCYQLSVSVLHCGSHQGGAQGLSNVVEQRVVILVVALTCKMQDLHTGVIL